jgi:hypothetical protein
VKLTDMPGIATLQIGVSVKTRFDPRQFMQFNYCDPSEPGTILVRTQVDCNPEFVHVSQERELPTDLPWSVQFVQADQAGPQAVTLYLQIPSAAQQSLLSTRKLTAGSLAELTREHPAEINAYLRPIFRLLKSEPTVFRVDEKAAFQVLADLSRDDPATIAAADRAVADLGADSYPDREAAMARLAALGEPAALYLMRARPHDLRPEQAMRLDLFLAPYRPLDDLLVRRMKSQADFLLDCLYCDDPAIQRLALEQLSRVTGRTIPMPSDLTGAVEKWRESFGADLTTQP